jgi:hypothetical protein
MWAMLTAWNIQLRTVLARLQLAHRVGSLPTPQGPIVRGLLSALTTSQHQPWTWALLECGARVRP